MTKEDWSIYARHILDCIAKLRRITERGDITKDDILYDAPLRNLQTLSESVKHLPYEQTSLYPLVPWKNIIGFRNIIVHDYLGEIDKVTVMNVIDKHLNGLEAAIIKMLNNL